MNIEIKETLEKLGLTQGEIKVYSSLINLGSSTVGPIIKNSQVSSSKVYIILDKLIDKGLATYSKKEGTKYFQNTDPSFLLEYVKEKEKEIKKTKNSLNKIIAQIRETRADKKEEVRIFKGIKGFNSAFEEAIKTIKKDEDYMFFSAGYGKDQDFSGIMVNILSKLKKNKIKIKGIFSKEEKDSHLKFNKKYKVEARYVDNYWPSDIGIVGNYILITVWENKEIAVYSISSKLLKKSYVNFFVKTWESAET